MSCLGHCSKEAWKQIERGRNKGISIDSI